MLSIDVTLFSAQAQPRIDGCNGAKEAILNRDNYATITCSGLNALYGDQVYWRYNTTTLIGACYVEQNGWCWMYQHLLGTFNITKSDDSTYSTLYLLKQTIGSTVTYECWQRPTTVSRCSITVIAGECINLFIIL
jgi:hypothetical protein